MPTDTEVLPGSASPQTSELPESMRAALKPEIPSTLVEDSHTSSAPKPRAAPVAAPVVEEIETPEAPSGLAAKLAAKKAPPVSVVPKVEAAPVVTETLKTATEIEAIETQMRATNKNWKPTDGWNGIKAHALRADKLEAELAETRKKLTTVPASGTFEPGEVDRLKEQVKTFSDELAITRLERHPDFQRQFVAPKQAELNRAKDLLDAHGVSTKEIDRILTLPRAELGKAVQSLVEKIPSFDQTEVADAIRKAYSLEQGGAAALSQSKATLQAIQKNSAERAKQEFEKRWLPVSAQINEHLVEMDLPANATPEQRVAAERYNGAIKSLRTTAEKNAFSPHDEGGIAELSMKAAAYDLHVGVVQPQLLSEVETLLKQNQQLAAELKGIRGRNPNKSIQAPASRAADDSTNDPRKMDHAAAADHFFARPTQ